MAESEPVKTKNALRDRKWILAMKKDLESIEKNNTWELVNVSKGKKSIDDLLITASNEKSICKFKSELIKEFDKDIYALKIFKKCDIGHCNAAITPPEPRLQLSKNEDEHNIHGETKGVSLENSQKNPKIRQRVYWLQNSLSRKKKPVVALSFCKVGCIAALLCVCQVMWLMNLLKELGRNEGEAVTLLVDNVSAINLGKNPIAHRRSKHIERRFHYLRELVSEGKLRLGYCISEDQVVDLLTK
ncbi:uncharacterized protein LOC131659891 [Vicia villosa]|uniref:uncharacterized protein LOC131659891 n=1 Tax=Vicia villosa TaxID=3911 RepID=UPI00273CBF3D|nr:uncharacterized protein LOC131659891 [Vicia villosa]